MPVLFLSYVTFCAIGPWFTPSRITRLLKVLWHACVGRLEVTKQSGSRLRALRFTLEEAFWDDPADVELLEEPILSWHLARPGLLLAALLMAGLTTSLGILGIRSLLDWLAIVQHHRLPTPPVLNTIPFNLLVLDLIASGAVALIILLIGYSVV